MVSRARGKVVRGAKAQPGKVIGNPESDRKLGMGIEVIERDINYLHLIRTLVP